MPTIDHRKIRKQIIDKCRVLGVPTSSPASRRAINDTLATKWSALDIKRAMATTEAGLTADETVAALYVSAAISSLRGLTAV